MPKQTWIRRLVARRSRQSLAFVIFRICPWTWCVCETALRSSTCQVTSFVPPFCSGALLGIKCPLLPCPTTTAFWRSLAGFGRAVKLWLRVKQKALRGFYLCADGRLYHSVVAEKALEADFKRWKRKQQTAAASLARRDQYEVRLRDRDDPNNDQRNVERNDLEVKGTKGSERNRSTEAVASGAGPPSKISSNEREYFSRGKQVLGKNAGGLLAKLLKAKSNDAVVAHAIIETASLKENPAEYVGAVVARGGRAQGKVGGFVEILAEKHLERTHGQRNNP